MSSQEPSRRYSRLLLTMKQEEQILIACLLKHGDGDDDDDHHINKLTMSSAARSRNTNLQSFCTFSAPLRKEH